MPGAGGRRHVRSSRGHSCRCCADESHQSVLCFIRARMRVSMSVCVQACWRAHLYCIRGHLCMSVHLLASTSKSERACFSVLLWRVCTPCPAVWVRKWPAAVHEAYLWVKLAKIHLIKCAFYSVSHKQIPSGSVHSPTNSITSSGLSSTSADMQWLFSIFFRNRQRSM